MVTSKVLAHSINEWGKPIATLEVTLPRYILAELNTHRMFSRNSSSSRAIPLAKSIEAVKNKPFIPEVWQKLHSGMQGKEYFENTDALNHVWSKACSAMIGFASEINNLGGTKQLANRLLEPFMWQTVILTSTEWNNFYKQRCPRYRHPKSPYYYTTKKGWKEFNLREGGNLPVPQTELEWAKLSDSDAELNFQLLANEISESITNSNVELLLPGQWHIPYKDKIKKLYPKATLEEQLKISTVMCARVSYTTIDHDLSEWTLEKYVEKYELLKTADPIHASPFEHVARCMTVDEFIGMVKGDIREDVESNEGWCNNFRAYIPLRYLVERGLKVV